MKNKKILIILFILISLTGCVKYDLDMSLKSDKSITITIIDAIDTNYYSEDLYTTSTEDYQELGFEAYEYNDGSYKGIKLSKKYDSIDQISSSDCSTVELTDLLTTNPDEYLLFKSQKEGTLTTYTANFTYNLVQETTEETTDTEIDYSQYTDSMLFEYTISFPKNVNIVSENADQKENDGYTLIWNMQYGELKNINFSFTIDDNDVTPTITEEEKEEEEQVEETIEPEEETEKIQNQNNTTNNNNNSVGNILASIIVIIIIVGLIFVKIKTKSKEKQSNNNLYHQTPHKKNK